tara:strand:- start:85 stop:390 length:306 start_codon:yes stop_codon:yes gene_type:complete
MKKKHRKHNSHLIFVLLGFLVLLFFVVFALGYYRSLHTFEDVSLEDNTGTYEEGIVIDSPFESDSDSDTQVNTEANLNINPFTASVFDAGTSYRGAEDTRE